MKTSCIRLAVIAASLLVASTATVQATTIATWNNWTTAQTGWPDELYANDSFGTPDPDEGILYANGGGIYNTFYYTFNDYVDLTLTPTIFESPLSTVTLEIKRTWNPSTNGPVNLLLHYTTDGINWSTATTPTPTIGGPNGDDFTYVWSLTGLGVVEFYIEWELIPHSTFDEIVLTQN